MSREGNSTGSGKNSGKGNGVTAYRNPVLYADYSDPDVIRVGKDFYMIASSFTYVPGVPVLHSLDLVHWRLINYCVRKLPFPRYDRPAQGCGTWAPSLRYHGGKFFAFIPMPDEGIFVTTAEDPAGEWTPLKCIKSVRGWIDPCPIWDEESGKAYMVFAYARSRCGIKHRLSIVEIDPESCEVIGEPVCVFDGILTAPTTEGPKFYRRNGWYYIFAPAGGVATGWQIAMRSRNVLGPYESRIVLHQGNTAVNGPHQGGYVELESGESFFIHFQDVGPMGRIIHLQPMCWVDDWPFIGQEQNGDGIGEPVSEWQVPIVSEEGKSYRIPQDDGFTGDRPGIQWQFQCNPDPAWYDCGARADALRLFAAANPAHEGNPLWFAGNVMTQIPQRPDFDAVLTMSLHPEKEGDMAGLGVIGTRYAALALTAEAGRPVLKQIRGTVRRGAAPEEEDQVTETAETVGAAKSWRIRIRMRVWNGNRVSFAWAGEGEPFQEIGDWSPVAEGAWTGFKVGIFALNGMNDVSGGYADMESIVFL